MAEGDGELGVRARDLVEKIADAPDEDSGVPEEPVVRIFSARALSGFSTNCLTRDAPLLSGLDVSEARVGPGRHDSDRDERTCC